MKISFISSDISAASRNDKVSITLLLSLGLREMETWEGLSGASSQEEPQGLMVLWHMLMNRQGKAAARKLKRHQDIFITDVPKVPLSGELCSMW